MKQKADTALPSPAYYRSIHILVLKARYKQKGERTPYVWKRASLGIALATLCRITIINIQSIK